MSTESKPLEAVVIEPALSELTSLTVPNPNKVGTFRFCVNCRRLNAATISDTFFLPHTNDCIDSLGEAKVCKTLEALWGYWQVSNRDNDKSMTPFTSHLGTYRYTGMPIVLQNAPGTYQRALDIILFRARWKTYLVSIDDVIIFSKNNR